MSTAERKYSKISTLLPVMNEVFSLNETINILESLNPKTNFEHIIILSPNSTTVSVNNAYNLHIKYGSKVRVIVQKLPGLGGALRSGIDIATGNHILMMASDLETDPKRVSEILSVSQEFPSAIICASRWIGKSPGFEGYGVIKQKMNLLFQKFIKRLYSTNVSDLTYGFRLYPSKELNGCVWRRSDFAFLLESILRPIKNSVEIVEVPVMWKRRHEGQSSNSFFEMFKYVLVALYMRFWE